MNEWFVLTVVLGGITIALAAWIALYGRQGLAQPMPAPKPVELPSNVGRLQQDEVAGNLHLGAHTALDVGAFYNQTTHQFLEVYGQVIQAYRTLNIEQLLHHEAQAMGLKPGMKVVDAGCGVCGPALFFAEHYGVEIIALTISETQKQLAEQAIRNAGRSRQIQVLLLDYHEMGNHLPAQSFDRVYFLESFGHSPDQRRALTHAWHLLKPGGSLYIKDLFLREWPIEEDLPALHEQVRIINEAYCYNIPNLYNVLYTIRKLGLLITFVRDLHFDIKDFENLTISNDFQNLFNIAKIDTWTTYVFPVDFYEILTTRPLVATEEFRAGHYLTRLYLNQQASPSQPS
jgi:ubiquinone/menaquinone biosynthesis C-methylase UbiE